MTEQMNVPKLRFNGFEGDWISHRINDVSECVTSGSRDWAKYYSDKGDKFVRMTNLGREGINLLLEDMRYVSIPKGGSEGQRTSLQENDILISITAELGKIGIIPKDFGTAYINQHTALVRVNQQVNAKFVAQNLATKKSNKKINRLNDSGAKSGLNLSTIRNFEFTAPASLSEQQKIASFLSKVDEKIALLTEKKDKLTEYKKGVMQQLFNGSFQEQDGQLTFIPPTLRFKADDGSEFPDWVEKKLGALFSISAGGDISKEHSSTVKTDKFKYPVFANAETNKGLHSYSDIYKVAQPCLTVSGRGSLGNAVFRDEPFYPIVRLLVLKAALQVDLKFYEYAINKLNIFNESTGVPQLTAPQLRTYIVVMPCIEEQKKIARAIESLDRKIALVFLELKKAKEWKKGLLQQMFV